MCRTFLIFAPFSTGLMLQWCCKMAVRLCAEKE
jgi:hypothetical protein